MHVCIRMCISACPCSPLRLARMTRLKASTLCTSRCSCSGASGGWMRSRARAQCDGGGGSTTSVCGRRGRPGGGAVAAYDSQRARCEHAGRGPKGQSATAAGATTHCLTGSFRCIAEPLCPFMCGVRGLTSLPAACHLHTGGSRGAEGEAPPTSMCLNCAPRTASAASRQPAASLRRCWGRAAWRRARGARSAWCCSGRAVCGGGGGEGGGCGCCGGPPGGGGLWAVVGVQYD